jgi:acetyl-CoA carboxylase alpha subunit
LFFIFPTSRRSSLRQRNEIKSVAEYETKAFNELKDLSTKDLVAKRMDKYSKMGEFKE